MVSISKRQKLLILITLILIHNFSRYGFITLQSERGPHSYQPWNPRDISLPTAKHHCIAVIQKKPITRTVYGSQIIRLCRIVESKHYCFISSIYHVQKHCPVTLSRQRRLEQNEIRRETHLS